MKKHSNLTVPKTAGYSHGSMESCRELLMDWLKEMEGRQLQKNGAKNNLAAIVGIATYSVKEIRSTDIYPVPVPGEAQVV